MFFFVPQQQQAQPTPKEQRLFHELHTIDSLLQTIDLGLLQSHIEAQKHDLAKALNEGVSRTLMFQFQRTMSSNAIIFFCAIELLRSRRELPPP
jgi:hypothetical protein